MAQHRTKGERLRTLADEMLTLADACDTPSRTIARAEMLTAEGERIAKDIWGVFRSPSRA